MQVFDQAPEGIQKAPHEPRMLAAGYQVALREVDFSDVHDKDSLMLAMLRGLALTDNFGRNWDALYDVLTDPDARPDRLGLLLCDFKNFRHRHPHLSGDLERVMLDAQRDVTTQGRQLWLLSEELDSDPNSW
ncbi:nuclease inhibitor [Deinococcus aerolatus]|uniref:Nuclease inhibitor n=1 Tax=Deinococcus aerolatus TaxID=522487 RepID=A0ABQ2G8G6_9DEIO|nr:barstar family protein [Deinococcus aerolatus]GGL80831.1 nuclease inhibitor [Deinococcus aerolatus]